MQTRPVGATCQAHIQIVSRSLGRAKSKLLRLVDGNLTEASVRFEEQNLQIDVWTRLKPLVPPINGGRSKLEVLRGMSSEV